MCGSCMSNMSMWKLGFFTCKILVEISHIEMQQNLEAVYGLACMVNFFWKPHCQILERCVSATIFFVSDYRDGFALLGRFVNHIFPTKVLTKHTFFMFFVCFSPTPIFTAKFSGLSLYDALLCLWKRCVWNETCIDFKTIMIRKSRTISKK